MDQARRRNTSNYAHQLEKQLLFKQECYAIQGAIFDVYREMGCGFLESVYQECLERELRSRAVPFVSQQELSLYYKGELLKQNYRADLVCYGTIIIELKAVKEITPEHKAQLLNYLKGAALTLGLLVNFGAPNKVQIVRLAN